MKNRYKDINDLFRCKCTQGSVARKNTNLDFKIWDNARMVCDKRLYRRLLMIQRGLILVAKHKQHKHELYKHSRTLSFLYQLNNFECRAMVRRVKKAEVFIER